MPLRILLSVEAARRYSEAIARCLDGRAHMLVEQGDADIAFLSRDVTGLSTKHCVLPDTQAFYDLLLSAPSLRWVHTHAAGADRPVLMELRQRGVAITTSSGANADVVAQTLVAALLSLARRFPQLAAAQRKHCWASLAGGPPPRDLVGQRVTVVGWGPIGQEAARLLSTIGLDITVVRSSDAPVAIDRPSVSFERLHELLPTTDWLLLACPLSARTRRLIDAKALNLLPPGAHLLNVARGEIIDESALIEALKSGRLAGAYLDVFEVEPLSTDSALWDLPHVIISPHSAGFSDGNSVRIFEIFLDRLRGWIEAS